jgi:subtilisin family serine protease
MRVAGAVLIGSLVATTIWSGVAALPAPSRAAALATEFSILRTVSFDLEDELPECGKDPTYIPDAMMRPASLTEEDRKYDNALETLLARQRERRHQEELAYEFEDALFAREFDVAQCTRDVEAAELAVRLFDSESNRKSLAATRAALRQAENHRDLARQRVSEAESATADVLAKVRPARVAAVTARNARDASHLVLQGPAHRGILVRRDILLILFRKNVPAGVLIAFVAKQRLEVRGGDASIGLLVVEVPEDDVTRRTDEGDATRIRAIAERLRQHDVVLSVVQDTLLGGDVIARPNKPKATARDWFAADGDSVINAQFPAAWNFRGAWKTPPEAAVLDVGFLRKVCVTKPCELDVSLTPNCEKAVDEHGTATAGVIGARFDDQIGVDGAAPDSVIHGCSPFPPKPCDESGLMPQEIVILRRMRKFSGALDALDVLLARVPKTTPSVTNASIGYNWSSLNITPAGNTKLEELIAEQGEIVRAKVLPHVKAVLVASAGNDTGQPAVWASPFNWAALGTSAKSSAVENVIVVEALDHKGKLLASSNVDGMISAGGLNVLTAIMNGYGYHQGTSAAAPLVTATVAMMQALDSTLDATAIKAKLGIGKVKQLNAFLALWESSPTPKLHVADLVRSGGVDEQDFARFKLDFLAHEALKNGQFTRDLNGDCAMDKNDTKFCRIDLNGDGNVTDDDLKVMQDAWSGTAASAADLRRRLYE